MPLETEKAPENDPAGNASGCRGLCIWAASAAKGALVGATKAPFSSQLPARPQQRLFARARGYCASASRLYSALWWCSGLDPPMALCSVLVIIFLPTPPYRAIRGMDPHHEQSAEIDRDLLTSEQQMFPQCSALPAHHPRA